FAESVTNFLTEDDFFINLDVVEGSQKVIQQLTERYEVYIVTAAMEFPSSMGPKYKWLKKHFPFLNEQNFVFCGDKSIIQADYLIDDTPKNLQTFKGKGLLFSAPHNMNVQEYTRLNNWSEVAQYFCHENFKTPSVRWEYIIIMSNFYSSEQTIVEAEELALAIEDNQFELYYQPKVNMQFGKVYEVEALIRWRHPISGMIAPNHFIPLAEETALIIPLGKWVIEAACRQIMQFQQEHQL